FALIIEADYRPRQTDCLNGIAFGPSECGLSRKPAARAPSEPEVRLRVKRPQVEGALMSRLSLVTSSHRPLRAGRIGLFISLLATLIAPAGSRAAEVIIYPNDPGWFTYLPVWGFIGITGANPRSGTGSLELMKPVGGGGAFINWTI